MIVLQGAVIEFDAPDISDDVDELIVNDKKGSRALRSNPSQAADLHTAKSTY